MSTTSWPKAVRVMHLRAPCESWEALNAWCGLKGLLGCFMLSLSKRKDVFGMSLSNKKNRFCENCHPVNELFTDIF